MHGSLAFPSPATFCKHTVEGEVAWPRCHKIATLRVENETFTDRGRTAEYNAAIVAIRPVAAFYHTDRLIAKMVGRQQVT